MDKQGTAYTVIFTFVVSFAFVFLLSMTNQVTIEQVELNQILARQSAVLTAMGIEAEGAEEIEREFDLVKADTDAGLYVRTADDRTVYAMAFTGAGLWGQISGFIAVTEDFENMVGLEFVEDNETPGLGGRINEEWFKQQFRDLSLTNGRIVVSVRESADPSEGRVDGITGATRTSDSIEVIVNSKLDEIGSDEIRSQLRSLRTEGGNT